MAEYTRCPDCGIYIIKDVIVCPYCASPLINKKPSDSSAS